MNAPPLPEAVREQIARHAQTLNQIFTVLRDWDCPVDIRAQMAHDLAETALGTAVEELSYIPERDGRRCVEHPHGDHELVCLTCMGQSRCAACGQTADADIHYVGTVDSHAFVASHPPPTPETEPEDR